nr:hypothetical protein [Tanacetum cinerariifolium]
MLLASLSLCPLPATPAPLPTHAPLPVLVQVQYQENRLVDTQKKRKSFKNLMYWKWDVVINLDDEEETPPESSSTRSVKRR